MFSKAPSQRPLLPALAAVALLATAPSLLAQFTPDLPSFSAWGADNVTLDAPMLDGFGGGCPIESADGLTLFTARTDDSGLLNLWANSRPTVDSPFLPGAALPAPVNLAETPDFCPTPLPGGDLLFVSARPGGCGSSVDIYFARLDPISGWEEPVSLRCEPFGPNTPGTEFAPSIVKSWQGVSLFYSSNFGFGDQDLMESRAGPQGFGEGRALAVINTPFDDRQPNVSRDGLEIVFASDRLDPGSSNFDIYYASRTSLNQPFSAPVNLSQTVPFSTADLSETRPSISRDGRRLVYGAAGTLYGSEREEVEPVCIRNALQPRCEGE
ncbi:MAG: TolB family protein [Lysobacterales bacterium]